MSSPANHPPTGTVTFAQHAAVSAFRVLGGELAPGGIPISRLAERVGRTPFYAYDRRAIDARVASLRPKSAPGESLVPAESCSRFMSASLSGFGAGQPQNGDLVEAYGTVSATGVLLATRLEKRSASLPGSVNDDADLEGLVTRFVSAADFDVAGQRVTTTAATRYDGGSAANLALNANIEVEGDFDTSGRVVATEIEFRRDSDVELSGQIESVNAAASTLVVLGTTVRTTSLTRFEDQSAANVERFGIADLRAGDYVEVRAYRDASGLVATLLERDDLEQGVELKGPATDVAQPNLKVGGIAVTTGPTTEYRDNNGGSISASAFFAAAPGREVKVRGTMVNNVVLAERAELED